MKTFQFTRFIRHNASFTILNIAGLAFGFACAILIILHVRKEQSYNSQFPDNEQVFQLVQKSPDSPLGNTTISYALPTLLADHFPEIECFARTENFSNYSNCIVSYQASEESKLQFFNESSFYLADKDLFRILQFPFVEGRSERALKEPNSLVLSKETSEKYFGNQPALGKVLTLNNDMVFIVTGVVDIPMYTTFHFSMLAPLTTLRSESKLSGWDSNGEPYFKLHKKVNLKDFNTKIEHFYSDLKPREIKSPNQLTLTFLPITERRLYYNKNPLYLLIFIGFVVLLVSMLNYINMSTSLVQKRTSEIALKKIAGASKGLIGFQFMKETALICFLAILTGIGLTYLWLPLFKSLTGSDVQFYFQHHTVFFILCSVSLWFLVTVLAGFYPAIVLSGTKPLTLFGKNKRSTAGIRSKNFIIELQFVISIILVILTLGIDRQYKYMQHLPLGFDNSMVLQIPFNDELKKQYPQLKDELSKIPEIKNVCAASSMPAGIPNHSDVSWIDQKGVKQEDNFSFAIVTDGYTQTFDMNMVGGREFVSDKQEDLKGVILNEAAARRLGFANPVGKELMFWGKQNTIVGVVKDFQNNYLFNTVKPMVMSAHPDNQGFTKYLYVGLLPGELSQSIQKIETVIKRIAPAFPFEYRFTSAEVQSYIDEIKQLNRTFSFASFVSILLALVGLIALTFHATQSRTKEIGVRKVNGAKISEIIHLLNRSFLKSILIAYVIACPLSWFIMTNLLEGIGNKTNVSWVIFAAAGLMVGLAALLTISWMSWKAATRNPVEALRNE